MVTVTLKAGFYGAQYQDSGANGQVYSSADLSMTFHITKYRAGNVPNHASQPATLQRMQNQPYPFGWAR